MILINVIPINLIKLNKLDYYVDHNLSKNIK